MYTVNDDRYESVRDSDVASDWIFYQQELDDELNGCEQDAEYDDSDYFNYME